MYQCNLCACVAVVGCVSTINSHKSTHMYAHKIVGLFVRVFVSFSLWLSYVLALSLTHAHIDKIMSSFSLSLALS